ncbi:MAG: hypothetical protein H0Z39_10165 [Peptococcaceae bacterium]|nr:hypothetical protein [Peptococcaceae bacterium]
MQAKLILKIATLTVLLFCIFAAASQIAGLDDSAQSADPTGAALGLLFVCFLVSTVISYPVIRSRWSGWKLVVTICAVIFGIQTFLTQIETIVFLEHLVDIIEPATVSKLFVQGAIIAVLFAPLVVLVHGKIRKSSEPEQDEPNVRLVMPIKQWIWKLLLVGVIYFIIYTAFGMFVFIPLAGEAFQEYYTDLQMPAWMPLFQMARALVWAALAMPIIRMMKGEWWEAGLAVALLYSILMGALLLIPTEIMPDRIRMSHLVEVTTSNFLFGWLVVWILHKKHNSFWELFQKTNS